MFVCILVPRNDDPKREGQVRYAAGLVTATTQSFPSKWNRHFWDSPDGPHPIHVVDPLAWMWAQHDSLLLINSITSKVKKVDFED